jgi:hypothetical protein
MAAATTARPTHTTKAVATDWSREIVPGLGPGGPDLS